VSAGPLRAAILQQLAPLARDVIVAGLNRDDIGILIFPDHAAVAALAPGLRGDELIADPRVRDAFARKLGEVASRATGSSNRVCRAIILAEPPDIDKGELTDKGTISQKAVLANRAGRVDELYAEPPSPRVLRT
jgi:feruloyl-CoA synthase